MSSEIIYKVKVLRAGPANNIVRGLVLACSSNCFPKPRRHEEPDSELFAIDLAQVVGIQAKKFSFFKTSIAIGIPVIVAATIIGAVVAANSGSGASTDTSGTDSSMMLSGMSLRRK